MKVMSDTPLLKLIQIEKHLPDDFYLNKISLELKPGEVHVVMGENGSGKSCLMHIISGLLQPDSGRMEILGEEVFLKNLTDGQNHSIIYIQQNANILQSLSVAENIFYYRMPYKNSFLKIIDHNLLNKMCFDLVKELDLPFNIHDQVHQLGLAQRQILGFCRAYVSDSRIVILDEPSASLTDHDQIILHTIINRLKERAAGILYISHNLNEIRLFGDRVSVLNKGLLAGTLDLAIHGDEDIIHLMSGAVHKNRYPRMKVKLGRELLKVKHLWAEPILKDINFSLHRGEIIGITGLAGSGRSYLAHCLFGVHKIDIGAIEVNGKGVQIDNPFDAIQQGIALVPEDRISDSLVSCLDISENVSLSSLKRFSRFVSLNTTFLNQVVLDYSRKFNVESFGFKKNMSEYSLGNQQKVVFAKWIMKRSRVFILDEPTRSLDIPSRVDLYNSMNDLISKGAGILFISSDIEEILGMCDRILVLSEGRFVCDLDGKAASKEVILGYATGELQPLLPEL
jgi:ribose transport system ATP-binding protein